MWKAAPGALIVVALLLVGAGQASAQEPIWLTYGCSPAPGDCTGWYRSAVKLSWDWNDIEADPAAGNCSTQVLTADTRGTPVACEVTNGTDSLRRQVTLHIDRTPPSVSAAPARPPDYNGWYNHPVSVAFTGADATSGVQSCTSAGYGGPDAAGVVLSGSCQDVAGNVGSASFPLNYDSTAPAAPDVTARPNDNRVTLRWDPPADAETIEVARMTGTGLPALVFRGSGTSFTDRELRNGKRHRYLITSIDRAGNRAVDRASAVPTKSHLLSPADDARLQQPPLLVWEAVRRATYYNVQLYRRDRKVLTRWPRREQLQLSETWRFAGRGRRLKPGLYTWFVFPGFGDRSKRHFGKLLGQSSFRVVK
jgi:hypothetical protein